jgi:uncharacterized protein (TIGR02001 family)
MKKIVLAALLVASSIGASYAQVSGNVGVTTDYRFRGISQTQNSQALQGGVDYAHKSGFYVGNWNSSVSNLLYTDSIGLENDLYVGFKKEVVKGVTVDVGSYNYFYSQAANRFVSNSNTHEVYAAVGYGPVVAKYSQSLGDSFGVANSKSSKYVQADLKFPIAAQLTADAHVGHTMVANHSTTDYTDYNVGATYNLAGFAIGAHYFTNKGLAPAVKTANTVNGEQLYKSAFVFSVAKAF